MLSFSYELQDHTLHHLDYFRKETHQQCSLKEQAHGTHSKYVFLMNEQLIRAKYAKFTMCEELDKVALYAIQHIDEKTDTQMRQVIDQGHSHSCK